MIRGFEPRLWLKKSQFGSTLMEIYIFIVKRKLKSVATWIRTRVSRIPDKRLIPLDHSALYVYVCNIYYVIYDYRKICYIYNIYRLQKKFRNHRFIADFWLYLSRILCMQIRVAKILDCRVLRRNNMVFPSCKFY